MSLISRAGEVIERVGQSMQGNVVSGPVKNKVLRAGEVIIRMDRSPAANNMCSYLVNLLGSSITTREAKSQKWMNTMAQLAGRFDYGWEIGKDGSPGRLVSTLAPDSRPRAVSENFLLAVYLQRMSRILQTGCEFNCKGFTTSERNVQTAEVSEYLLNGEFSPQLKKVLPTVGYYVEFFGRVALIPQLCEAGSSRIAIPTPKPRTAKSEPYNDAKGQQTTDDGYPLFYELGEDGKRIEEEFKKYGVRILVVPPWNTIWDPRHPAPSDFMDSRWFAYEQDMSRSEIVEMNEGETRDLEELSFSTRPELTNFSSAIFGVAGISVPSNGNEETGDFIHTYIPPRKWAEDDYDQWLSRELQRTLPGKSLEHGLDLVIDRAKSIIVYAATFPGHAKGKIENVVVSIQQLPVFNEAYPMTMYEAVSDLDREMGMSASDISQKRKQSMTDTIVTAGANTTSPELKSLGAGLALIDLKDVGPQPIVMKAGDISASAMRWHQQLQMDFEHITNAGVIMSSRPRTATESNIQEIRSGMTANLTNDSYTEGIEQAGRIYLLQAQYSYNPVQVFKVKGKFDEETDYYFRKADLDGECSINLLPGIWIFGSPAAHMQMVDKLAATGAIRDARQLKRMYRMRELFDQTYEDNCFDRAQSNCRRICVAPENRKENAFKKVADPADGQMKMVPSGVPGWEPMVLPFDNAPIMLDAIDEFCCKHADSIIAAGPIVLQKLMNYRAQMEELKEKQLLKNQLQQNPQMLAQLAQQNAQQDQAAFAQQHQQGIAERSVGVQEQQAQQQQAQPQGGGQQ